MMKKQILLLLLTIVAAVYVTLAERAGITKLPEGRGLAARYAGDKEIEKDRAVIFAENFEVGSIREIGHKQPRIRASR